MSPRKPVAPPVEIPKSAELLSAFSEEKRREYVAALRESLVRMMREEAPFAKKVRIQCTPDLFRKDVMSAELVGLLEEFHQAGYLASASLEKGDYGSSQGWVTISWETPTK